MSELHQSVGHHGVVQPPRLRHQQLQPEVQDLYDSDRRQSQRHQSRRRQDEQDRQERQLGG